MRVAAEQRAAEEVLQLVKRQAGTAAREVTVLQGKWAHSQWQQLRWAVDGARGKAVQDAKWRVGIGAEDKQKAEALEEEMREAEE